MLYPQDFRVRRLTHEEEDLLFDGEPCRHSAPGEMNLATTNTGVRVAFYGSTSGSRSY